jgi:hypothetical protein
MAPRGGGRPRTAVHSDVRERCDRYNLAPMSDVDGPLDPIQVATVQRVQEIAIDRERAGTSRLTISLSLRAQAAIPLVVQRWKASTHSGGQAPSHGIVPAFTRSRIASAFARTSS